MNVKRFIGRNSREAMQKVKAALGDEAIVLSTKPAAEGGIEILAMGAEGMAAVESMSSGGRGQARDHRIAGSTVNFLQSRDAARISIVRHVASPSNPKMAQEASPGNG